MIPLLILSRNRSRIFSFFLYFLTSFFSYLIILYWIPRVMIRYGGTSPLLGGIALVSLSLYLSLYAGLAGILIRGCLNASPAAIWLIPAIWVGKDWLVEHVFSGFPWCSAGYSQYKNILFSQVAEMGGIHLVAFLVVLINVMIFFWLRTRRRPVLILLAAVFFATYTGGYLIRSHDLRINRSLPEVRAGLIQPNVSHDIRMDSHTINTTLDRLFDWSRDLIGEGASFVIWPEYTVPIYPLQNQTFLNRFNRFAADYGPILAGFTDFQNSDAVFNSLIFFNGSSVDKYDKFHLTPFGEYIPFRKLLFFVKKITDEIGDFTPAPTLRNLNLNGNPVASPICYEIIFPELNRFLIARGGKLIVTVSNDSWLGHTIAPYQHLAMAAFRAIENRRYILRCTSNGISAVISPAGTIQQQASFGTAARLLASFKFRERRTVFNRFGYLFPVFCLFITVIGYLQLGRNSRKKRKTGALPLTNP